MSPEAAARRLAWDVTHPPVYHRGVSEQALRTLRSMIGDLETADPVRFEPPPEGDADVRRHVRFLAALAPDSVPDTRIPGFVRYIINNPHLSLEQVRDIMDGRSWRTFTRSHDDKASMQADAATLRKAGQMLREGRTHQQVADATGLGRNTLVSELAAFLGVAQANQDYLRDAAADHLEEGDGRPQSFAAEHGMSVTTARALLKDVALALVDDDEEAVV